MARILRSTPVPLCQCGEVADPGGRHLLVCKRSTGRASPPFALNDIIFRRHKLEGTTKHDPKRLQKAGWSYSRFWGEGQVRRSRCNNRPHVHRIITEASIILRIL